MGLLPSVLRCRYLAASTENKASDSGAHGSASRENPQGSTGDDTARLRSRNVDKPESHGPIIVDLPFEPMLCPICVRTEGGNYVATDLNNAIRHRTVNHASVEMRFRCRKCSKVYEKKHACLCHIPKCPGTLRQCSGGHTCTTCGEKFTTVIGLGQHERHRHPAVANEKRQPNKPPSGVVLRSGKTFSIEDKKILLRLEVEEKDSPLLVRRMAELTGKTIKQIRDKRAEPAYIRMRDAHLAQALRVVAPGDQSAEASSPTVAEVRVPPKPRGSASPRLEEGSSPLVEAVGARRSPSPAPSLPSRSPSEVVDGGMLQATSQSEPSSPAGTKDLSEKSPLSGPAASGAVIGRGEVERAEGEEGIPTDPAEREEEGCSGPSTDPAVANTGKATSDESDGPASEEGKVDTPPSEVWRKEMQLYFEKWDISKLSGADLEVALLMKRGVSSQEEMDRLYDQLISLLGASTQKEAPRARSQTKSGSKKKIKQAYKRFKYARASELFKKDPALLAKLIRTGVDYTAPAPRSELDRREVEDLYKHLWGTRPRVRLEELARPEEVEAVSVANLLRAITEKDIRQRLSKVKSSSAPGPDGIKKTMISGAKWARLLAGLYNLVLVTGNIPSRWNENRTLLIPKEGKDASKATNYRPLTISSLLSRLFWGIVDQRIREVVKTHPRQKGFVAEAGCFANLQLLDEAVRRMKNAMGGVGIQLDISKAFDTVPHEAIRWGLERKGMPPELVNLVVASYNRVKTIISHPGGNIEISLQRGVKQGDPLSPLLFNLAIDALIEKLEHMSGLDMGGENLSCLAFADDLYLLASDAPKAQCLLDIVVDYLGALGMGIAASKSFAFQIKHSHGSWSLVDPGMERLGERIPQVKANDQLTYLGVKFSPWSGISLGDARAELSGSLARLKAVRLKPDQKLQLLRKYIIPHYLHQLVIAVPAISVLRGIDQELRVAVKEYFHLPMSTANGLIHCRNADGGLGVQRLAELVPRVALSLGLKMASSSDPLLQLLASGSSAVNRLRRIANSVRINYPYEQIDLRKFKTRCRKEELANWGGKVAQGKSVNTLAGDRVGNSFLANPGLLKPCRFITALQLRANVAGNKTTLNRAAPVADISCRKCKARPETLAHVLGGCTHTKGLRIRRHDEIKNFVEQVVLGECPGMTVTTEAAFPDPEGAVLKPDLVIKNREGVLVVDVTVRHEDGDNLQRAHTEKVRKYQPVIPAVREMFGCEKAEVLPIVVGLTGAMPPTTIKALARVGIKKSEHLKTISLIALRSSIELFHAFMDYEGSL